MRGRMQAALRDRDGVAIALVTLGLLVWGHQGWPWILDLVGAPSDPVRAWMLAFGIGALATTVVPALVLKLGYRARLADYGMGLGDWRRGLVAMAAIAIVGGAVMFFFSSRDATLRAEYPLYGHAILPTSELALYELSYLGFFMGGELAVRGILLFAIARKSGSDGLAVLVCAAIQIVWHTGKPLPELLAAPVWGVLIGVMSLRLRSAWFALIAHWLTNVALDLGIMLHD